ncbi:MAG: anthranilate synthase component I family protein [Parachlamydia sp.]|nr:anthranilate synthase component I family protein [Parachlamydia sp.]
MFRQLSLDEFRSQMVHQRPILVYQQFTADTLPPILCYDRLSPEAPSALIEIHYPQEDYHYSFLGFDPYLTFQAKNGTATLETGNAKLNFDGDPLAALWQVSQQNLCVGTEIFPNFFGGLIGFMAYDAIRQFENLPDRHPDLDQYPDLLFHAYRMMLCFDHKTRIMTLGLATPPHEDAYVASMHAIQACYENLLKSPSLPEHNFRIAQDPPLDIEMTDEAFRDLVTQVQESIQKGEVSKTIISRTFSRPYAGSPFALFRASRMLNPSPCHFLLSYPAFSLVGASPGKLLSAIGRELEITPLAGTYPRKSLADDRRLDEQLLHDPKETAEHMMLVEAVKKDLAKVSTPGSVRISKLMTLEHFSHVTHIVSYVNGTLDPRFNVLDALKAAFPAGTLSGIPRVPALKIIDALEKSRRGLYAGAVCALDARGNLDSVLINRTAVLKQGVAYVRAGAGIVHDSDPQKEADESRHKARAMLESLKAAETYFF